MGKQRFPTKLVVRETTRRKRRGRPHHARSSTIDTKWLAGQMSQSAVLWDTVNVVLSKIVRG